MVLYGLNTLKFSHELGYENNGNINNITGSRQSKPGFDILAKILDTFPDIREAWLIKGTGAMLYSDSFETPAHDMVSNNYRSSVLKTSYKNKFNEGLNAILKDAACSFLLWCDAQPDFNERYAGRSVSEIYDVFENTRIAQK